MLKLTPVHLHVGNDLRCQQPLLVLDLSGMAAAASTKNNAPASAEQPAIKTLPLAELNQASSRAGGKWDVCVWRPFEDEYKYTWNSKPRTGTNFVCTLVSPAKPEIYCMAAFKKTSKNAQKYGKAVETFVADKSFLMSQISFTPDAKTQYINAPLKFSIDLSSTTMTPTSAGQPAASKETQGSAVQPAPSTTVAKCSNLGANQFFDVTALVQDVGETHAGQDRSSFLVTIFDGSLDEATQKVKMLPLTVFFDSMSSQGQDWRLLLEEHKDSKQAVSFFCIAGGQDDQKKFQFRSTRNVVIVKAKGAKADQLNCKQALHNLQPKDVLSFEIQESRKRRDWSQEPGRETRCKLLATFARTKTGIPALDDGESVWQINWVKASPPAAGQNIKSQDGKRLWFPVQLIDETGPITLYITEDAAIKLSKCTDAAEFEQFHANGRLLFPLVASVKAWRRPTRSAEQPASAQEGRQNDNDFDCFIVDADDQDLLQAPSAASTVLLPMLTNTENSTNITLPATLDMICTSEHYAMAVECRAQRLPTELTALVTKDAFGAKMTRPCSHALVLISSSSRSKPLQEMGTNGYKLVTDNVVDLLSPGDDASKKKYSITSFCTLDNMTDFKLDPPARSKSQAALICITGTLNSAEQPVTSLLVESVQLLPPPDAEAMKSIMRRMIYFTTVAGQVSSNKRERDAWTPEANPATAASCRNLGRSPTGPALPEYEASA